MEIGIKNPTPPTLRSSVIGVIGAGVMGRGIAQLFAQAGLAVRLYDVAAGAADAAIGAIHQVWSGQVAKGRLDDDGRTRAVASLGHVTALEGLKDCDVIIEAIVERLDVKRTLFTALEDLVGPRTILASNTSSLAITDIAAGCRAPGRVAGLHFFNPVPLMKIAEVIAGARTDEIVCERLAALVRETGHSVVRAADMPGFLINHAGRGYGTEALAVVGEGVATFEAVDRILREQVRFSGGGFRLGPFELLDLTGLDVSHAVMESIYDQFYQEPRFRPSPLAARRRAAGLIGRKAGQGFYDYRPDGDGPRAPALASASRQSLQPRPADAGDTVHVMLAASAADSGLQALVRRLGGSVVTSMAGVGDHGFVLCAPLGLDAAAEAVRHELPATHVVAIDTLFDPGAEGVIRRSLMPTVATDASRLAAAVELFGRDGAQVSVLRDSPGFVAQRVIAMIVSVATEIAQQRIATPADIDLAVRMGLGYPVGPLTMGDELGPARVLSILQGIEQTTGDPRYRPGGWLRRRATLGLSLLRDD